MEDTAVALKKREYRLHEKNTEPPEIAANSARKIVEFLIREKGIENGELEVNILCVLGAGWDETWREAFENQSKPGLKVKPKITVFDYNESQIKEFGKNKNVVRLMIGDEADNDILEDLFEDGVDVFIPSNVPDWLTPMESINFARLIKDSFNPPLVIAVAGKRAYGNYGHFVDELEDTYDFDFFESSDKSYEVGNQAIGYLA